MQQAKLSDLHSAKKTDSLVQASRATLCHWQLCQVKLFPHFVCFHWITQDGNNMNPVPRVLQPSPPRERALCVSYLQTVGFNSSQDTV